MEWISRYTQLLEAQSVGFVRFGNLVLREYGQIIIPIGPVIQEKTSVKIDEKKVFKELKGKLVWWSYFQEGAESNNWYAVIKDTYLKVEEYPSSKMRNKIRNSLKNFEIRQVSSEWLSKNGYEVYKSAVSEFLKPDKQLSTYNFDIQISKISEFEDIVHYWGVFKDEQLIGYAVVYLYENSEANISEIRINKSYIKLRPSYALLHRLSEEYLEKRNFGYLNNGYRNLLHDTEIQHLLMNDFGYKKLGLILNVKIKFPLHHLLMTLYPFRKLFNSIKPIKAIFTLIEIVKQQKRLPK